MHRDSRSRQTSARWLRVLGGVIVAAATALVRLPSAQGCDPTINPVLCENQLTGNPASEWDISGSGDSTIQGFATDISVNKGSTIAFKVSTTASKFNVNIYRLGYYGGLGARKVATISSVTGKNQASCLTNSGTGLIDCGNWTQSTTWAVPSTAVSGVYVAKISRADTGGSSHIVFIVRDDSSHSDVVFQTSDTTWEAYNQYGGKSLYVGGPGTNPSRAYKVSYNRPFTTRGTSPADWLFNAEYPMIRWLEANGYNTSYTTGVDSDRRGTLIPNHKIFLSVGHDEYWSGAERTNVENARGAGVNLVFLSGNEVFWKTRWENSIDGSSTTYRTLVSYKETHNNAPLDPLDPPTWTGTWMDPRFSPPADGGRPQNALTGTLFTVNCCTTTSTISVPQTYSALRFWRNTRVATLPAGGSTSLSTALLGYEWDADVDNGFRPAGLVDLSATAVTASQKLQDYGSTYASGTAIHQMTLYRHSSGALVFSAGTVQWTWGLDGTHDQGGSTPDTAVQQAMVNVLADMRAQPASLQAGLVAATASTDTVAPTSTITSPSSGATVPIGVSLTISGTASDTGGGVVAGVEVSVDGGTSWHPASGTSNWTYTWTPTFNGSVTIKSRAVDDSANLQPTPASVTITTGSGTQVCPCTIWPAASVPAAIETSDTSAVEVGVRFRSDVDGSISGLRFYKGTGNTGTHVGSLWSNTGTLLARATFSGETAAGWQQVLFTTPVAITANTTYVASYHTNVGNYAVNNSYFKTAGMDNAPLHAPTDGLYGANGIYAYSGSSVFPNQTYQSSNYWVDVVFNGGADTTAPSVAIASPSAGATVSGSAVAVTASASDNVGVAGVQFKLDGVNLGAEDTATPYSITWDSTTATNGSHTFTAVARDAAGNTTTSAGVTVTVFNDTTAPTVSMTAPAGGSTVSGTTVAVSATASDNVGVAGVQLLLDGAALGPELTTAPYQISWNSTTQPNGAHTLAARARDSAGNQTTSTAITIVVANPNALGLDALVSADQSTASSTVSAAGLTTSGNNEVLLAFVSGGWVSGTTAVTSVTGGGLTWELAARTNAVQGTAEIWRSMATAPLANVMVTATFNQAVSSSMTVAAFTGMDTSGTNGSGAIGATKSASGTTGAPSATLTTTRNGSWVFGVGSDTTASTARSAASGQAMTHQLLAPAAPATYWVQQVSALVPASNTVVTVADTAPATDRFDLTAVEILAAPIPDTTPPAVAMTAPAAGTTVAASVTVSASASDNVGVVGVQFVLDGANLGAEVTASPFSVTWNTLGSANGTHTLRAVARDAAGNTATSASISVTVNNDVTPPVASMTAPQDGASVSGSAVTVSASVSDNVGVAGVQFLLDGAPLGSPLTSAPYSVAWNSTAAANGSHTLAVRAWDAAGNAVTSTSIAVTVNNSNVPLTIDVVASGDQATSKTTVTSSTFSTTAGNELLLAFIATDDVSAGVSVGSVTGAGLTWQLVVRTNVQRGTAEIWRAFAPSTLTNVSVTATITQSVDSSLTVVSFKGADPSGTSGSGAIGAVKSANASSGAPAATVSTTRNGSWVFAVGNDWDAAVARTVPANQTLVHQYFAPVGDTYWVQRMLGTTPLAGTSVTINDTAPTADRYNFSVVEVLPASSGADTTPPTIVSASPAPGSSGAAPTTTVTATFSEAVIASTITGSSFTLRDSSNAQVAASVAYDSASATATLTPSAQLAAGSIYTATVSTAVTDLSGNALAAPVSWSFATAPSPTNPTQGTGGPILVVTSSANPFTQYYAEILHAEGLNAFTTADASQISSAALAPYRIVILGEQTLTSAQVSTLTSWVQAGGNLIAMRPDSKLGTLLGLGAKSSTVSDGYLLIDTSAAPGAGLVNQTIQFHGTADAYSTPSATVVATLYTNAVSSTAFPAVTVNTAGAGVAAAFTFDVARSVVYTRQGNPAWAGQERDGIAPIRPDDLFYGAKAGDAQPDWVDLTKVAIPQSDELQRLLANIILQSAQGTGPIPRFWYFPNGKKAAVVMTGDDHGNGGEVGRFGQYLSASPSGCVVANWDCIRGTAYIYPATPITDAQVANFLAQGFEIALHVTMDPSTQYGCGVDYTPTTLASAYTTQLSQFTSKWPSAGTPLTHRMHCLMWSDWFSQPTTELQKGIRFDTSYYYWPSSWINDTPGVFTGSGMPMRYASQTGSIIDVFQAVTQMTDESGQSYPFTIDTLLDNAIGPLGYFGAFTANMHNDSSSSSGSDAIVASAKARGVPVVSSSQMLKWLDGRYSSNFSSLSWDGTTLTFSVVPGSNTMGLTLMLPTHAGAAHLTGLLLGGAPVSYGIQTIKGVEYAMVPVSIGPYAASYAP